MGSMHATPESTLLALDTLVVRQVWNGTLNNLMNEAGTTLSRCYACMSKNDAKCNAD
ncbi:hypothetical protein Scep_004591 [Stephania cephalantha]|uniref:Uncharacterized protein n=1 Tax=Stephania cephalantha TaxID=152367 RepID=A0AAP0PVI1_9MAGN